MTIELLYFAQLRDVLGNCETLTLDGEATVADVVARLRLRPQWRGVAGIPLRFAVNEIVVSEDTPLHDGDVVALLPPVSGG